MSKKPCFLASFGFWELENAKHTNTFCLLRQNLRF
jgi:hypothetical protein